MEHFGILKRGGIDPLDHPKFHRMARDEQAVYRAAITASICCSPSVFDVAALLESVRIWPWPLQLDNALTFLRHI